MNFRELTVDALLDANADRKLVKSSIIRTLKFTTPPKTFTLDVAMANKTTRLDSRFVNLVLILNREAWK